MTTGPYHVAEVEDAGNAACTCDNCGWPGSADQVVDVQDCSLTPGDSSPVGRCPVCDGLCYLNRPLRESGGDWRPIDTAPKDCYCIGFDPHLKRPFVMIWNIAESAFVVSGGFGDEAPTLWIPLPPLPSGS